MPSEVSSDKGWKRPMPAFRKAPSNEPKASRSAAASASAASGSAASLASASTPASSARTLSRRSGLVPVTATRAPARCNNRAVARPMPLVPPVTRKDLPLKSNMIYLLCNSRHLSAAKGYERRCLRPTRLRRFIAKPVRCSGWAKRQGPRATAQHSAAMTAPGPWRLALLRARSWSLESVTHLQAFGAFKQTSAPCKPCTDRTNARCAAPPPASAHRRAPARPPAPAPRVPAYPGRPAARNSRWWAR